MLLIYIDHHIQNNIFCFIISFQKVQFIVPRHSNTFWMVLTSYIRVSTYVRTYIPSLLHGEMGLGRQSKFSKNKYNKNSLHSFSKSCLIQKKKKKQDTIRLGAARTERQTVLSWSYAPLSLFIASK